MLAISVLLLAYVYAGYPALIGLWARWRPRPVRKGPFAGGVSVLIAEDSGTGRYTWQGPDGPRAVTFRYRGRPDFKPTMIYAHP